MSEVIKLTQSLQESVLTLLCLNDQHGAIAAGLVQPELFEPPYDDIATRALAYRVKFKKAPGEAHIDDLFDHILSDPKNKKRKLYQQILGSLLKTNKGINPEYALSRVDHFVQEQTFKIATLEAAERMERGGDDALAESRNIMTAAMNHRPQTLDSGMFLSDRRAIDFLNRDYNTDYSLGIDEFDRFGIGVTKGEALGFLGKKGAGKTFFCTHTGVMALLQGAKVAHASLEMGNERMMPRYLRRLFAIAKRHEKYKHTILELDEMHNLIGLKREAFTPDLALNDSHIERKVRARMTKFGTKLDRLVCKTFPTKSLTMSGLVAWLDGLERSHSFMPDVLIVDYPKLMRLDNRQDLRIALGTMMEELRGLCGERNMGGVFPLQANRSGESTKIITSENIGEDYSLAQTVDTLITYNQTKLEKEFGMARLYVDKARSDRDGFTVLCGQDYETGQFVRTGQTVMLKSEVEYFEFLGAVSGNPKESSDTSRPFSRKKKKAR